MYPVAEVTLGDTNGIACNNRARPSGNRHSIFRTSSSTRLGSSNSNTSTKGENKGIAADCSQTNETNDRAIENKHCQRIRDEEESEELSSVEMLKQMSDIPSDEGLGEI